ncbi:MAG TPA: divalent-cation tolerance protein CutA [Acidobacteriota bacterium]|nr:divalent-cation tolerance protein CutA [Acidobacteriota bacterium]
MSNPIVILSTAGSEQEASKIAEHLVINRLAACVNIVPEILSVYRWKGDMNREKEVLMIIKTDASLFIEIEQAVRHLHSYEVPELIAFPIQQGLQGYMDWIQESVSKKEA